MRSLSKTRALVRSLELDVLVFVEIGMGMCAYFLAFAAPTLAKKSMMFWGHGVTSGIRQGIDYFITSKKFHGNDHAVAQESFVEQLYLMESLTVSFQPPPLTSETTAIEFDLRRLVGVQSGEPHFYLAPTSLYKFHPLMDRAIIQLLHRDPQALIVLVKGNSKIWAHKICTRIHSKLLQKFGPEISQEMARRLVVVPAMVRAVYLQFLRLGHVVMLPFPTTSSVTVFETISVGTPFVSYGGSASYLLQHYAPGILLEAGVDSQCCIALTEDDYLEKLLRLGTNTTYRDEVSRNILRGRDVLFHRDMKDKVVNEWEKMFHEVLSHTRYMYVKEEVHVRSVLL
jgi:predicted O-linked N-acetylglucosamine transferase (SPINDLY family)